MKKVLAIAVTCPKCQRNVAGYDAFCGDSEMIGDSVKHAAEHGFVVRFLTGPVELGEMCKCENREFSADIPPTYLNVSKGDEWCEYAINQWRAWVHCQLRDKTRPSEKHPVVDEIFNLALIAATKTQGANQEVNRLLKVKLLALAESISE